MGDTYAIFLDTEVFEAASFNFKTTVLTSLEEQIQKGVVRLVLTDITVREVKARIEKDVVAQLEGIQKFIRKASVLRSSSLPEAKAALELKEGILIEDLQREFDGFLARTKPEIVDTSGVGAGPVFAKYFAEIPPFGSGDKKAEFPDAFVIEALAAWAGRGGRPLYVISGDRLFREACQGRNLLGAEPKLATLLNRIILDVALAAFLREQTSLRMDEIREEAKTQFEDRLYNVDDEWGDVEMSVDSLEDDGEPEVIEADEHSATLEVDFKGTFTAYLSYDDSSTGVYDSETKSMWFMERRRDTRNLEESFVVEVKVTFQELDPDSFEIEEVSLIQPDESYSVSTRRWDDE